MSPATRAALWRIHGLAALLATPFLLVAAITGLVYVPAPQVEAWRHGHLDQVARVQPWQPLDRIVDAARAAAPDHRLRAVRPPHAPGDTAEVRFDPPAAAGHGAGHASDHVKSGPGPLLVYVDPGTAQALGQHHEAERFAAWARRLHSQWLLGEEWRWMIEWAATCLLVMLSTGAALAWPRRDAKRAGIRKWHAWIGLSALLVSVAIVATGLTWSRYAGAQIRVLRDAAGQAPPRMPAGLASGAAPGATPLTWQAAWDAARRSAPDVALQLVAPRPSGTASVLGPWRVTSVDTSRPLQRIELALDAYTGREMYVSRWHDLTWFAQATAIGIPFHRGEFGLWNQALLAAFGLTVLGSTGTGWWMWWRQPRRGGLGLPALPDSGWRAVPARWPLLGAGLAACAVAPLLLAFIAALFVNARWRAMRNVR